MWIKKFIDWISSAFDVSTVGGASSRKLSAWWMVMLVTALELTYVIKCFKNDKELTYLTEIIWADLFFAAAALGMTLIKGTTANNTAQKGEKKDETS